MNKAQCEQKLLDLRNRLAESKDEKEKEKLTLELSKVVAISLSLEKPMNRMIVTNE